MATHMRYSGWFASDVLATVAFYEKAFSLRLCYMHPSRGYADGRSDMGARSRLTGQLWSTMVADALFASPRPREYLTPEEVDLLIATAQKHIGARTPHRDATPILMAYRHGLRASELCSLRWDMLDLS
jgi:integrase